MYLIIIHIIEMSFTYSQKILHQNLTGEINFPVFLDQISQQFSMNAKKNSIMFIISYIWCHKVKKSMFNIEDDEM